MSAAQQPCLLPVAESRRPEPDATLREDAAHGVRLRVPERQQVIVTCESLDGRLAPDHRVRGLVAFVEQLPMDGFLAGIQSRGGNAGAPAFDPRLLLALWVWAVTDGVGSARRIARLVHEHDVYRWIAGGLDVSAHTLSDFRRENGAKFDDLVTTVVALAVRHGLVELWRTAQDGTRVRTGAAPDSFRREATLETLKKEAEDHVREVLAQAGSENVSKVQQAARERGARERLARVQAALAELPKVAETKQRNGADPEKSPPRASTTDAEARVMKMGDGGFRPAYNLQFAENTEGPVKLIVGVSVTNCGSDQQQATPMRRQIEERYGVRPAEHLADGGYGSHEAICDADKDGCDMLTPLAKARAGARPPEQARPDDPPAVAAWRERMQTDEAKQTYRKRAQICELPHADGKKDRALDHLPMRGLDGAFAFATLFTLAYDIARVSSFVLGGGALPS
jgi:transposase